MLVHNAIDLFIFEDLIWVTFSVIPQKKEFSVRIMVKILKIVHE